MSTCQTWDNPNPVIVTESYQILPVEYVIIANAPDTVQTLPSQAMVNGDNNWVTIKDNNVGGTVINTPDGALIDGNSEILLNNLGCITVFPNTLGGWSIQNLYEGYNPPTAFLDGYAATTGEGYPDNGLLLVPAGRLDGILIGNDGKAWDTVLQEPAPEPLAFQYYYVNATSSVYPSTGMLILADGAASGNGGLLLGDDGSSYNISYDGTTFSTIGESLSNVTAGGIYPVNGVLLSKSGATTGNASILFGVDGNIYNLQIA